MAKPKMLETAIVKSRDHWKEMRKWVRTQKPTDEASPSSMANAIGQYWRGDDCALCSLIDSIVPVDEDECDGCPIAIFGIRCTQYDSPWEKVDIAETWRDWYTASNEMFKMINQVLRKFRRKHNL